MEVVFSESLQTVRDPASSYPDMPASSASDPVNPPQAPNSTFPSDGRLEANRPAFDLLNADITKDEVEAALLRLKQNKAAAAD